ncbi:MAG: FtsX-like permease family protein [Nannocystaceae bacterium]
MRETLESWIAWRHLRARGTRRWPRAVGIVSVIVIGGGVGALLWARSSAAIAEELAGGPAAELFVPAAADIASLAGLIAVALGVLCLGLAVLVELFNLLSAIIILSVAQGCMALVVVLSLMTGLEQDLQGKIIRQSAEIRITDREGEPFTGYADITRALEDLAEVDAASPYAQGEVMIRSPYNRSGGVLVGVLPEAHARVSSLAEQIDRGDYRFLVDPDAGHWDELDRLQKARDEAVAQAIAAQQVRERSPGDDADDEAAATEATGDDAADPSEEDSDGWEDPSVEVPKIRGDADAPNDADDPVPAAPAGADDEGWDDEGWEDPSVEIPKLREEGVIPPKVPPVGADPERDPEGEPAQAAHSGEGAEPAEAAIPTLAPSGVEESEPAEAGEGDPGEGTEALVPLLLGAELIEELGVPLGARIQVITPIGRMTPSGQIPGFLAVRVVGVFYSGNYEYDHQNVYAPLDRVQALLRLGDAVTGIDVKLTNSERLDPAVAAIRSRLADLGRDDLKVETWRELHKNLFSAMFLEKVAMFIGLLFVVLVAAFGILATNLMSVLDKAQEIAILKAMGSSDRRIARVFMLEGMIVGVVGSAAGIGVGLLFCAILAKQGLPLPAENFYTQRLPVVVSPLEVCVVGVSALVIVWLSSVYPARTAARLRPVDGLRSTD